MHNIYYLGLSGEHRCPLGYLFQTPRSIVIFKCTNLKVVYRITLIVLIIGRHNSGELCCHATALVNHYTVVASQAFDCTIIFRIPQTYSLLIVV